MRILHYIMGTPPVRIGGLVKYAHDLMIEQQNKGEEVILLVPGSVHRKQRNKTNIVQVHNWECGIRQYQIKNALPIPMANGIRDIEWYTTMGDYEVYKEFLQGLLPDIIHIHSLMGIHANFFVAAHDLKIPIIFTSHDFFGVCPKTQFVDDKGNCEQEDWNKCWRCCQSAFSSRHLVIEQSELYRYYRNNRYLINLVQILRGILCPLKKREISLAKNEIDGKDEKYFEEYKQLREYYRMIFKKIDMFHFNSSVAKEQYEKSMPFVKEKGRIIPITNAEIKDNRKKKEFGEILRIGYLGGNDKNKGCYFLQDVVQHVIESGRRNIEVHVYSPERKKCPDWICIHEPYNYSELSEVMESLDVVVMPSLLRETFGLVALEAFSYGVPVILTETVGAKDILLNKKWGYCIAANQSDWQAIIKDIYDDRNLLRTINADICKGVFEFVMKNHLNEIERLYFEAINIVNG